MRQKAGTSQPPWLPLTRELSPQATEGENLQSVCSAHPRFAAGPVYLSLRQALRACHLPRQREARRGRERASFSIVPRPKRRGFTGGTWFRPSDRARPPPASAGVRFSAIHLPEIYGILGVPAKAALLWGAVPQWRFRRNARDRKGELANPKGLTEGLWVSCRNGLPITGHLLLHQTYNPSASHPLSTSPYTGEARGGRRSLVPSFPAKPVLRGTKTPPCLLDKAASGCYIGVSKNGCHCRGGRP